MKRLLPILILLLSFQAQSQTVFGFWYGSANVKTTASASNYMVELVLMPGKDQVTGLLNYYFKNIFRSIPVKGNYNPNTRLLSLYNVPVTYYGSFLNNEVDCIMNLQATLRVSQVGSVLSGAFIGLPNYSNTCPDILFNFTLNAPISKKDSVLKAISEFKESVQVWKPREEDTLSLNLITRKVINYVIERQFTERELEFDKDIEVFGDSLKVDFYDNGEIDGDSISVFFNKKLIAYHQKLSTRSIHFDMRLDSTLQVNEISMFAENLGTIPPNTALMIIDDGKTRHLVRIASTLQKNGTIRIRRKPPGKMN